MHAGVKYVMFSELIGGQGPADIATQVLSLEFKVNSTQMSSWAHMCDPFAFSEMRRIAYRNHGLQVCPRLMVIATKLHGMQHFAIKILCNTRDTDAGARRSVAAVPSALVTQACLQLLLVGLYVLRDDHR